MIKKYFHYFIFSLFILLSSTTVEAKSDEQINSITSSSKKLIGKTIYYLEDTNNTLTIHDVMTSDSFQKSDKDVPNFGITNSYYWIKFSLYNTTDSEIFMEIAQPIMDEIEFYNLIDSTNNFEIKKVGEIYPFSEREFHFTNYVFNLKIRKGETKTYYIKVKSTEQIQVP
ncbi:MAG TPA: 7TM-DISM domain-containing protein, partial [Vicingus sp.]|nr:7TM-DISM domain-containing protein [Vicingus sp.]